MNKTKKIAAAVVSLVLASSMCLSIAACSSSKTPKTLTSSQDVLDFTVDDDGNLDYASGTALNMNVGYSSDSTAQISYTTANLGGSVKMPDGVTYSAGKLKPAWAALESKLDVSFTDSYTNKDAGPQVTDAITNETLGNYNVITAESATIVTAATSTANTMLDLSLYLDYMPNYKKFLQDNPIVYMSLTSDTESGAMYYAPYFDGNDDIEKYEIAKKNWITRILDGTYTASNTITFVDQATAKKSALKGSYVSTSNLGIDGTQTAVESYMGTTGSWSIVSTDSTNSGTVTITVNYDDALEAAKDSTSTLGGLLAGAGVTVSELTSGNIVDLQNAAINANNGNITGDTLTQILRAYIDVAYQDANGNPYYTNRADVFNGYDAAWDVDLFVALQRCVVTFGNKNLGTDTGNAYIYGVTGRQNTTQRMNDMVSFAGELYGVRGLASRYNYTYIDENGVLQEARVQEETYDALDKMHAMVEEGLYNASETQGNGTNSYYTSETACEALMGWDYVQTQTANGGYTAMGITDKYTIESDYDFEPIVTPVSKWDDGTSKDSGYSYSSDGEKYMRFTESWRSVKTTGFCVPYASVANDPDKLSAVLTFIDYFFSNDGQILMSFGTRSDTNSAVSTTTGKTTSTDNVTSTDNGWWYAAEVSDVDISTVATKVGDQYYINDDKASQYFCFENKLYTGTYYNGKQYPQMTNASLAFYYGYEVNGLAQSSSGIAKSGALSYTGYARYIIGAALPIGNKLQAFEFQCTSDQGINGGNIVAACLNNGTISHVYQTVGDDNGKGYWYTIVPSTLPYTSAQSSWITDTVQDGLDGTVFCNTSKTYNNFFIDIIYYGLGAQSNTLSYLGKITMPDTASACIAALQSAYSINTYVGYMQSAWQDINGFYDDYISLL